MAPRLAKHGGLLGLLLLSGCGALLSSAGPDPRAPIVQLVDSIAWDNGYSEGILWRVQVAHGGRVDTIPDVRTIELPVVTGAFTVFGFDYEEDWIRRGYQYDPAAR